MKKLILGLLIVLSSNTAMALDTVVVKRGPIASCFDCKIFIKEVCVGGYVYVVNVTENVMVQKFVKGFPPQPEECR